MYPAHASLPLAELVAKMRLTTIADDLADPLKEWRAWFREAGDGWQDVACIECELGRRCLRSPPCEGAEVD